MVVDWARTEGKENHVALYMRSSQFQNERLSKEPSPHIETHLARPLHVRSHVQCFGLSFVHPQPVRVLISIQLDSGLLLNRHHIIKLDVGTSF